MPKGPALMVAATSAFTLMIGCVKLARPWGFGTAELMGWRAFVAIPVLLLISRSWRVERWRLVVLRCVFGFAAMFCYYSATRGLGIGELSVITKLQPILIALVAPRLLGTAEKPGPRTWMALGLGFAGTLSIAWPTLGEGALRVTSVFIALGAAVFSTLAHTILRALKGEDPRAIVFWFQLAVGAGVFAALALEGSPPTLPTAAQLPILGGIGLSALAGQLLMTKAYASDTAARVATAGLVGPLLGFLFDYAVLGDVPSAAALVGGTLILAAGWVLFRP